MPSGWLYCVQGHPPRSGPALLRTMRGASGEHSTQLALHAGLVRKKTRNYNGWAVFMRFLTLRTPRKGFLGYFFAATLRPCQQQRNLSKERKEQSSNNYRELWLSLTGKSRSEERRVGKE